MNQRTTVLIVEDQHLLRIGLRVALENSGCCAVIGEAGDGLVAVREALRLNPVVVLMDIGLPGIDGIEATWRIKNDLPRTRVIMFTSMSAPDSVSAAFGAGADGYCVKDAPVANILTAIKIVARGEFYLDPAIAECVVRNQKAATSSVQLSDDETQILALIRDEISNDEIAARLNINPESVARVIHNAIGKFVGKKIFAETSHRKDRIRLNQWFTSFVDNLDNEAVFSEKYLIQSLIGSGGIGAVFKAKHLYINRTVAIKMLHPELTEDKLLMRGFQREGAAIASLHHKNLVAIHDFGLSEDRQPYLVMEYIDGRNLAEIITNEGCLDPSRALKLFTQVCDGLSAAHEHGIVHCDLKPSNILIVESQEYESVKLVDFGLVQMLPQNPSHQMQLTEKYVISGTPTYMSPEQCLGKALDERSDIYSLGCVLFECLTGHPVFQADTALEIFSQQLRAQAPSMRSVCPQLSFDDELEELIACMLAKEPSRRPQSMNAVKISILNAAMAIQEGLESSSRNAVRPFLPVSTKYD